jgi:hypothetical protein
MMTPIPEQQKDGNEEIKARRERKKRKKGAYQYRRKTLLPEGEKRDRKTTPARGRSTKPSGSILFLVGLFLPPRPRAGRWAEACGGFKEGWKVSSPRGRAGDNRDALAILYIQNEDQGTTREKRLLAAWWCLRMDRFSIFLRQEDELFYILK